MENYEVLFTPCKIGKLNIKNRIVMCPMGTNAAYADGSIAENRIEYYARRAKGGAGMIILGCQFIRPELASGCMEGTIASNTSLPRLSVLCEKVHQYGAKICAQLSCGVGRNAFPERCQAPISASAIPAALDSSILCHEMTKEEIKEMMDAFTKAAHNAASAGFDAIEIHAHAGYLVDQFLSPVWNKRTDEYGGSLENRTRFAREILEAIRKGAPSDMPVIFRISLDHRFEGGRGLEESLDILKELEKAGVDAFDVDAGSYETIDYIFPTAYLGDSCMAYTAKRAKEAVSVPILNAGNHTPETAAELIKEGGADFVMVGRGLIADPDFPRKLRDGRRQEIRPCIRCNEDCIGRTAAFRMSMLSCAVNPEACQEQWFQLEKTENPKKVCVIGAGPAGLEAARAAAECGHAVTVYEKESQIGGQLTAAATPVFKGQLRALLEYYRVQLAKLGVSVVLSHEVKAEDPELAEFDRWIVAAGANPFTPPIPGMEGGQVISVLDAHRHKEMVKGSRIVICGGGLSGCDCALELAMEYGKRPVIVEMMNRLAPKMIMMNRASMQRMLQEQKIEVYTGTKVEKVEGKNVHILGENGSRKVLEADTVISAFGMRPDRSLADELEKKYGWKVRSVGDCSRIGRVGLAVRDGYFAGSTLDE